LGCAATASTSQEIVGIKPVNSLDCTINGENVSIDEHLNAQQVQHNVDLAKGVGCSLAKQFGLNDIYYVQGYNWTVSPNTASTAQAIQMAIGAGKVVHIHC
jgi:hypothetical protein